MKENPQNQLKLSQLRILAAVADCLNFSAAALKLEISQSAVSHGIAALENYLGVSLVVRGRHGAQLTPVGQRIVERAQVILQEAEAIKQEAAVAKGLKGGQVRIAAFRSIATHVLPAVIAQFHQKFPEIAVSLSEQDDYPQVEKMLREGRADVGFTFLPTGEDLETREVLRDEYVALLPASAARAQAQLTWAELVQHPLIMPPVDYVMMREVYNHAAAQGYPLKVTYEMATDATIVNLVAQGLGASILPRLAAEPIPPGVQIFSLPIPLTRTIGVAVLADALHTPAVYAFLDVVPQAEVSPQKERMEG